nr:nucleolin-like isoform X2 [Parasteatoda tepidariorum]
MEIELSNKLGVVLCDLETCFTAHKLNSHDDQPQENFQSDVNNDIAIIEQSDHESECNLPTMNSKSVNGDERNLSWDKNLVVEVCDLMVCSRKNCDIPDCEKDKIREQIHELKKRKVDQQYFRSKKKQRYKEENDDDASDIKEITNGKKVDESSDDHDSDIVEVSNDESDPNFKEETSEEEFSYEESDDSDWEEKNIPGKRRERMKKVKLEEKEKQTENLSSYELERQKHLDDKMAFLKSLMIDEIVDELEETAKSQTQRKPRVTKPKEILEVSRKSKRMENVKINLSEKALEAKVYDNATTSNEKPEIPSVYSFEDALHTEEKGSLYDYDKYFMDMEIKEETSNTK